MDKFGEPIFAWPALHEVRQKPLDPFSMDNLLDRMYLGHGAHMTLALFIKMPGGTNARRRPFKKEMLGEIIIEIQQGKDGGEMDQPRLRLRIRLAPSPTKHGLPLRLRGRVHLPSGIAAHIIPGSHGPRTPPRLRRSGIHIPPSIATQVKAGMETGGMPAETATRHQIPRVGMRATTMRMRMGMRMKRLSSNVKNVDDGKG